MGKILNALQKAEQERKKKAESSGETPGNTSLPVSASSESLVLTVPRHLLGPDLSSPAAEQFRLARNAIRKLQGDRPIQTILVTPCSAGCTAAVVACNLAETFANEPADEVLLVDADPYTPGISALFRASGLEGLFTYVEAPASESEASTLLSFCRETNMENLVFLPAGSKGEHGAEIFIHTRLAAVPEILAENFRASIFAGPPVVEYMDTAVFASMVDGVILVIEAGKSSKEDLIRTAQLLHGAGANLLGTILSGNIQSVPKWLQRALTSGPGSFT